MRSPEGVRYASTEWWEGSREVDSTERWPSGRRRQPGKLVYEVTCIEGSNPSLSAIVTTLVETLIYRHFRL